VPGTVAERGSKVRRGEGKSNRNKNTVFASPGFRLRKQRTVTATTSIGPSRFSHTLALGNRENAVNRGN
jgi:hypothetical protein